MHLKSITRLSPKFVLTNALRKTGIESCYVIINISFFVGKNTAISILSKLILDYSEYATIQGLCYIFSSRQSMFGRLFWILAVCFMLGLGTYWSCIMYIGWRDQQVSQTKNLIISSP